MPTPAVTEEDTALPALTESNPWLGLGRPQNFYENEEIGGLIKRGVFYARAGVPIHFQGAAGLG
jgi:hypothetical protein